MNTWKHFSSLDLNLFSCKPVMSKVEIPGKTEYSPCGSRTVVTSNFLRTRRVHIPAASHADMRSAWPKCCVGIQLKGDSGNFAPASAVLVLQLVELLLKQQSHIDKQDVRKPEAVVFCLDFCHRSRMESWMAACICGWSAHSRSHRWLQC